MLTPVEQAVDRPHVRVHARPSIARALTMARRRASQRDDGGFSLVELMIALFVFALLASGFAMTMGSTLRAYQRARVKTLGEQIANDKLEDARRMPYDSVGNDGGNPDGEIPLTQTQYVGGYKFTVTTKVSYVDDPVDLLIATGADYKKVVVTVASVVGAPPVTMSTYIAPPARPAVDKGRVSVTVNDIGGPPTLMPGVTVKLINGSMTLADTTNVNGVVDFAALPPSPNIPALSPVPGPNDYYYVTGVLPAGYSVYPSSDYTRAGSPNKFQVAPGVSYRKNFDIYKAASVSVLVTDAEGQVLQDPATLTVTPTSGLPSETFSIAAGSLGPFSKVGGVGIIPQDTVYKYAFAIDAGGGCTWSSPTDPPLNLLNPNYPSDTSVTVTATIPCSYADVNLHVIDADDPSANLANTTVTVTGGPMSITRTVTTDANGVATLRVRADVTGGNGYTATVPAQNGRPEVSAKFTVPDSNPVNVTLPVSSSTKVITVNVTDGLANVVGATVTISGGPTATVFTGTTNSAGQYVVSVPFGTGFPDYTIHVLPDAAGRQGVTGTVPSSAGDASVALVDPWATVNVHVSNPLGAAYANATIQVTGGPPAAPVASYTTDLSGNAVIRVPSGGTANYVLTVPAQGSYDTATFTITPTRPVPDVAITVPWKTAVLTVELKKSAGGPAVTNTRVQVAGGPAGIVQILATPPIGQTTVAFTVPIGTGYVISLPDYPNVANTTTQDVLANKTVTITVVP